MAQPVRFERKHNRTATDIYNNMIRPRLLVSLDDLMVKIVHHARQKSNYRYKDRTGALTNSKTWVPAIQRGNKVTGAVLAGGKSKTTKRYVQKDVFYRDELGRLRHFVLKTPKVFRSGQDVFVNYAVFVERMGLNVLLESIERMKRKSGKILAKNLRIKNLPRSYRYKYTGQTVDIFGSLSFNG